MVWNYALIKNKEGEFDLHEVYYEGNEPDYSKVPGTWSEEPCMLGGFASMTDFLGWLEIIKRDILERKQRFEVVRDKKGKGKLIRAE